MGASTIWNQNGNYLLCQTTIGFRTQARSPWPQMSKTEQASSTGKTASKATCVAKTNASADEIIEYGSGER